MPRFSVVSNPDPEVFAEKLNQLAEGIEARTPRPGSGTKLVANNNGFSYSGGRGKPAASAPLGFKISPADTAGKVLVSPSVVTGFDTVYVPENSGGTKLDNSTPPEFTITNNTTETIYLKFTMEPVGKAIPGVSPSEYVIDTSDNDLKDSKITVETSKSGEALATITAAGAHNADGVYFIPLGTATNTSNEIVSTLNYGYGPISCKLCEDGIVSVSYSTIIHTGSLETIS